MYIVHVVQAHTSVRPRAQRCSPVAAQGTRSRHTWWNNSREPPIIYMPPTEQGVIYKVGSTLYGTPGVEQVQASSSFLASGTGHSSMTSHPAPAGSKSVTVPAAAMSAPIAPRIPRAAGALTSILKPWDKPKTLMQLMPAGSSSNSVPAVLAAATAASSDQTLRASSGSVASQGLVICLPDGDALVTASPEYSSSSACDLSMGPISSSAVLPVTTVMSAAVVRAGRTPHSDLLLHHAAHSNNCKHLIQLNQASGSSSGSSKTVALMPAAASAAALLAANAPAAGSLQYQPTALPPAGEVKHHPSSSSSAAQRMPCGSSSSRISATPAFSIPGYYAFDQGPLAFSMPQASAGGSNRGGGQHQGAASPGVASAAGGGRSGSVFGALPLASLKLARMGVALMGLAAAAAIAVALSCDGDKCSVTESVDSPSTAKQEAVASKHQRTSSSSSSTGMTAAAEEEPGFHEWMVHRLQTTLQQFDAECDLLKAELDMLQTLKGRQGSSQARSDRASASAAVGSGLWGLLVPWSSRSSSTDVVQSTPAALMGGSKPQLSAAAIAARISELHDQMDSLDVLKAALTAELREQQQQLQQQQH